MPSQLQRIEVPAEAGRTWTMRAGETVRIVAPHGPQAADVIAFNRADLRESLSTWLTRQVSGSFKTAREIYSKLPAARLMFTVLGDSTDRLWLSPGRCNVVRNGAGKPNCHDILAECIAPLGLSSFDVPEVLNVFMNVSLKPDGTYDIGPSPIAAGDYLALRAEMDVWMAVSACPDTRGNYNLGGPKPLAIEVYG